MAEEAQPRKKSNNGKCFLCMCCGDGEDSEVYKPVPNEPRQSTDASANNRKDLSHENESEELAAKALDDAKAAALRAKQNLEAKNSRNIPVPKESGKDHPEDTEHKGKESQILSEVSDREDSSFVEDSGDIKEQQSDQADSKHDNITPKEDSEINELTNRFDTLKMVGSARDSENLQESEHMTDVDRRSRSAPVPDQSADDDQEEKDPGQDGGKDEEKKDDRSQSKLKHYFKRFTF